MLWRGFVLAMVVTRVAGAGWVTQESGTSVRLNDVTANHGNINNAWACGDEGVILHTSDGGQTWVTQESGTALNLNAITFVEAEGGPVMAVGDSGIILRTLDEGETWEPVASPTTQALYDISDWATHLVGDSGVILESDDAGASWTQVNSPTAAKLNSVTGTFTFPLAVGDSGVIVRDTPLGEWETVNSGTSLNLYGLPMFSNAALAVGAQGTVLESSDFGLNWFVSSVPVSADLSAVEYSINNLDRIYAVGDAGTIIKSTDGGNSWNVQPCGTACDLRGVFFYLDDWNGWAVGDSGTILRTYDGGQVDLSTDHSPVTPRSARLLGNYPNPFNASTSIGFELTRSGHVQIGIYDLTGRHVATAADGWMDAGTHRIGFDAGKLPSGMYVYRLRAGDGSGSGKMVMMR